MTSAVLAVRQDELEREAQLDRLREVCRARGINVITRTTGKHLIFYIQDLNVVVVSENATGSDIDLFIQKSRIETYKNLNKTNAQPTNSITLINKVYKFSKR